jgi:hypothetical protein
MGLALLRVVLFALFITQGALAAAPPSCDLDLTPHHSLPPWLLERLNSQTGTLPPELIEEVRTGNVGVANEAVLAAHADLPRPAQAGRNIAIQRKIR